MTRSKAELIRHCKNLLKQKAKYLYGFKYEKVTSTKLERFFKQYPSYYTETKKELARTFVGSMATDCSGLISSCTNKLRSSQNFHDSAVYVIPITPYYQSRDTSGLAVWKPGHIGVSIGKNLTIEAKGIYYGVVQTVDTPWTHYLYLKDIDYIPASVVYPSSPVSDIIWVQDKLNRNGADLEVDGIWGAKTTAAVLEYAKAIGKEHWCKKGGKFTLAMINA